MSEPHEIDDHTLMAYLDGELATPESEALEAVLAREPGVEARLREMAYSDSMLRASMRALAARHAYADAPPDEALLRVVPFRGRQVRAVRAMAAGLILALGAGVLGFAMRPALLPPGDGMQTVARRAQLPDLQHAALQAGLENDVSGQVRTWRDAGTGAAGRIVPVRSWRSAEGSFCREFDAWQETGAGAAREGGIACRDASGSWRVRVRYYPQ